MPATIWVMSCRTGTMPSSVVVLELELGAPEVNREVRSMPLLKICSGYSDRVDFSVSSIYWLTPADSEMMRAMPMMPMEPAKAVSRVRAFLVKRLLKLRPSEVRGDMDERPMLLCTGGDNLEVSGS